MGVGIGGFVFLCGLIFAPLVCFSSGSVLMVPNPVRSASLTVSLYDKHRSYRLYAVNSGQGRPLNVQTDLKAMNRQAVLQPYFEHTGTQVLRFPKTSDLGFDIPPPLMQQLIAALRKPNATIHFQVEVIAERDLPVDNRHPSFKSVTVLSETNKMHMATMIHNVVTKTHVLKSSFTVPDVIPDIVMLPSAAPARMLGVAKHGVLFTLHRTQTSGMWDQWWELEDKEVHEAPKPIDLFAVSAQVIGTYMGIGSAVSQLGVVGLYVSVVFVVGRLLRGYVANLQTRVMYEDMDDVTVPMYLCQNIYLARQEAGTALDGTSDAISSEALLLENHLYWELIRLYRQPEKLYRFTTPSAKISPEDSPLLDKYKAER